MTVTINAEDEKLLGEIMRGGSFESSEKAVHVAITMLASAMFPVKVESDRLAYADESISQGLADAEAGRVISSEQFLNDLRARRQQHAA